jgi:acetyl-CoA carboxylase biotin carboxyl carrier protein
VTNIEELKEIMQLMQGSDIQEIKIREGTRSIWLSRVSKNYSHALPPEVIYRDTSPQSPPPVTVNIDQHTVNSPMVGTIYLSPTPDALPYVKVGQKVAIGDTLCLIEAMKMFNAIESDKSGTITACLINNGSPVEYSQPLFVIE